MTSARSRMPSACRHSRKSVQFDHVSFTYGSEGADARVLHDINLEVRRGEVVAIVGSSGSGKSTLVHLIPRFFDATQGGF